MTIDRQQEAPLVKGDQNPHHLTGWTSNNDDRQGESAAILSMSLVFMKLMYKITYGIGVIMCFLLKISHYWRNGSEVKASATKPDDPSLIFETHIT